MFFLIHSTKRPLATSIKGGHSRQIREPDACTSIICRLAIQRLTLGNHLYPKGLKDMSKMKLVLPLIGLSCK